MQSLKICFLFQYFDKNNAIITSYISDNQFGQHSLRNTTRHPFKIRQVFIKEYYKTHGFQNIQRSGFHVSSGLIAEKMTRGVSYMMIGRITRTAPTIIKHVLLISEIGSCVIYVYTCIICIYEFCVSYQMCIDICHSFAFVFQR